MKTKIGAIFLVAGTCIGSGMIALPLSLAKLGLIPSLALMLLTWFVTYYTSIVNLELNLQANKGLPLGSLAELFSNKAAKWVGNVSLQLLSYALLSVFIYGGASILKDSILSESETSFEILALSFTTIAMLLLALPIKAIDYANRIFFVGLMAITFFLIISLTLKMDPSHLPYFGENDLDVSIWLSLIPILFTSFGYQVIFHTLANYCKLDQKILKQAFFWGSLIPAVIYILWTSSIIGVLYHENPQIYTKMVQGKIVVGQLISALSQIAKQPMMQHLVKWVSLLAIFTSVLGVGIGLIDSYQNSLAEKIKGPKLRKIASLLLTLIPPLVVAIYLPNAFIKALGFAGMILAIIAILLPIYLLKKINNQKFYYPELNKKWLIRSSLIFAIIVILSELLQ